LFRGEKKNLEKKKPKKSMQRQTDGWGQRWVKSDKKTKKRFWKKERRLKNNGMTGGKDKNPGERNDDETDNEHEKKEKGPFTKEKLNLNGPR